jgi:cellulose synthase/poly-beta-1,6-N-acetylglucosamine synthase-like glycosyltransferase
LALAFLLGSLWLVLYHHVVYPYLLRGLGCATAHTNEPTANAAFRPTMTCVVPAHNEEQVIARKIANIAALDYPADLLDVVIVFDGCTDATEAVASRTLSALAPPFQVRLVTYATNLGKVAVLNEQIARATTSIVVLTDASASVGQDALLRVAAGFDAKSVGVVCGTYSVSSTDNGAENLYWRYQTALKAGEAAVACPMGAHGAFYAIRREAWQPLAPDTVNDDFVLPMGIVLRGYEAVYDKSIVAHEWDTGTRKQDFWRRVRIGAGNIQQVALLWPLADPRRARLAFLFLSGKALRAAMPFALATMTAAAFVLALGNWIAFGMLAASLAMVVLLGLAEAGVLMLAVPRTLRPVAYVAQGHAALALGSLLWLAGSTGSAWTISRRARADRAAPEQSLLSISDPIANHTVRAP